MIIESSPRKFAVKEDKSFHYSMSIFFARFLLKKHSVVLDDLFEELIFTTPKMTETRFTGRKGGANGPWSGFEVSTIPARVLGPYAGSAGTFSTVADLERFRALSEG